MKMPLSLEKSEYLNWLQNAGFHDTQVIYSVGEKHMIIGVKKNA